LEEAQGIIEEFADKGGSGHICGVSSQGLSDKDIITIAESIQALLMDNINTYSHRKLKVTNSQEITLGCNGCRIPEVLIQGEQWQIGKGMAINKWNRRPRINEEDILYGVKNNDNCKDNDCKGCAIYEEEA